MLPTKKSVQDDNNNNYNSCVVLYPKMSSRRCTISKVPRDNFVQKYRETIFLMYYIDLRSTTKWKQRSTDKDTTSKLQHSKTLTLKKEVKQRSFTLSTNIQTTQLTLSNAPTQDET